MSTAPAARDTASLDRPLPRLPRSRDALSRDLAERAVAAVAAQALLTRKPGLADCASDDGRGTALAASAAPLYEAFRTVASSDGTTSADVAAVRDEAEALIMDDDGRLGLVQALRVLLPLVAARAGGDGSVREVCARAERVAHPRADAAALSLVTGFALPALYEARACGLDENAARLDALLALMARRQDPAVADDRGPLAVRMLRRDAAAVLEAGGRSTEEGTRRFGVLEDTVRRYGITPADSAGLLAATLFLDALADPAPRDGARATQLTASGS
ncbi:triphosphoribosyl-dephospho-CoA synthase [Streptomyces sp. Q6]|uniref:Triphosphoribosyl-dephospho-CoA synthase n=1 Tax=Streptomyces citrinus TaxID=3118173 RepID=A0ACD5ALF0_9ACTN